MEPTDNVCICVCARMYRIWCVFVMCVHFNHGWMCIYDNINNNNNIIVCLLLFVFYLLLVGHRTKNSEVYPRSIEALRRKKVRCIAAADDFCAAVTSMYLVILLCSHARTHSHTHTHIHTHTHTHAHIHTTHTQHTHTHTHTLYKCRVMCICGGMERNINLD